MLRRCIPVWFLIILVIVLPSTAPAQTRFFERGDSGFILTYDFVANQGNSNSFNWSWGTHASFTYKGLFDVGGGIEGNSYGKDPWYLFARAAVIQPKSSAGLGLELTGRYTHSTDDRSSFQPILLEDRDRTYSTGLRGYYRNAPATLVVGLGGRYIFNKDQILDQSGEVMYGHDYGEVGFALDGHFLASRLVHFSLLTEYAQDNHFSLRKDWKFKIVMGVGFLIGLDPVAGGGPGER